MKATSPAGETWRVSRRWLPWRPRWRKLGDAPLDAFAFSDIGGILATIAFVVVVFLLVLVVFPLVVLAAELIVVLLATIGLAGWRLLLGKPWIVEAATAGPPARGLAWTVRGWRASGNAIAEVGQALEAGRENVVPTDGEVLPA